MDKLQAAKLTAGAALVAAVSLAGAKSLYDGLTNKTPLCSRDNLGMITNRIMDERTGYQIEVESAPSPRFKILGRRIQYMENGELNPLVTELSALIISQLKILSPDGDFLIQDKNFIPMCTKEGHEDEPYYGVIFEIRSSPDQLYPTTVAEIIFERPMDGNGFVLKTNFLANPIYNTNVVSTPVESTDEVLGLIDSIKSELESITEG